MFRKRSFTFSHWTLPHKMFEQWHLIYVLHMIRWLPGITRSVDFPVALSEHSWLLSLFVMAITSFLMPVATTPARTSILNKHILRVLTWPSTVPLWKTIFIHIFYRVAVVAGCGTHCNSPEAQQCPDFRVQRDNRDDGHTIQRKCGHISFIPPLFNHTVPTVLSGTSLDSTVVRTRVFRSPSFCFPLTLPPSYLLRQCLMQYRLAHTG